VALAGLSLGTGATAGAALGGMLSQGLGPLGRRLAHQLRGLQALSLEDAALLQVAAQHLTLLDGLERRGHAALAVMQEKAATLADPQQGQAVLRALRPARGHPEWADDAQAQQGLRETQALLRVLAALLEAQSPSSIRAASGTPARPAGNS
jgi:chorismate mutase